MNTQEQTAILMDIHARVKSIEDRIYVLPDIERRLRELEVLRPFIERQRDHEERLRRLEHAKTYLMGVAATVGAVVSFLGSWLKERLGG